MQYWNHDELHALMDADPALKARSDTIHNELAQAHENNMSVEKWVEEKRRMFLVYANAVGCQEIDDAIASLEAVAMFIKSVASDMEQWQAYLENPRKDPEWLSRIVIQFEQERRCHSPSGNDYRCYCHEAITPKE